jgi:hypothetical protein
MSSSAANSPIKYVAECFGSREVTLYGKADLDYWTRKLADEKLVPYVDSDHAHVMITAVASRWSGVRFTELIIGVVTADEPGGKANGMLLLSGYNTSRVFTFFEYYYFGTPYAHASVAVACEPPESMCLSRATRTLLSAQRRRGQSGRTESVDQQGPAYLPRGKAQIGKVYYVRIRGKTEISPFDGSVDTFAIKDASEPVLLSLAESGFVPQEWHLRPDAYHARSKTYARTILPASC